MSVVTNTILASFSLGEEGRKLVNEFFPDGLGFVWVDDPKLPPGWYGGSKYLECDLAIGAFNHLDLNGLIEHLHSIELPCQLIVQEQEDFEFRIIDIAIENDVSIKP